jgi:branched-chain amino acid transport system ATP-binding protein
LGMSNAAAMPNIKTHYSLSRKRMRGLFLAIALIGANGAGKTTLLRALSGLEPAYSGRMVYRRTVEAPELELHKRPTHEIVAAGIAHAPEGRGIFPSMTVAENLALGAYLRRDRAGIAEDTQRVFSLFPRLQERQQQLAGTLSGGEQQMLAIGRALLARPTLLLLDEPSLGLAPLLVDQIFRVIEQIRQTGVTVLLVEQNAHRALELADEAFVLENGRVVLAGPSKTVRDNDQVRKAYLGED